MIIKIADAAGDFAEDKDKARAIRTRSLEPALKAGKEIRLDFSGVNFATQSFIHALLAGPIRRFGPDVLNQMLFVGCNDSVKDLIEIVVSYSQDEA